MTKQAEKIKNLRGQVNRLKKELKEKDEQLQKAVKKIEMIRGKKPAVTVPVIVQSGSGDMVEKSFAELMQEGIEDDEE